MESSKEILVWRQTVVYTVISAFFLGCLVMLNILGITKFVDISTLFFVEKETFWVPIGVLAYPITFLCTDLVSELFGKKHANLLVWLGLLLNILVLFILWLGGVLPPGAPICEGAELLNGQLVSSAVCPDQGVLAHGENGYLFYGIRNFAFGATMASMIAYLLAQFSDVFVFHKVKQLTGGRYLWLRNNLSTLTSQMIDSFAVIIITYYFVDGAIPKDSAVSEFNQIVSLILSSYFFKMVMALADTIPFYFLVKYLHRYMHNK